MGKTLCPPETDRENTFVTYNSMINNKTVTQPLDGHFAQTCQSDHGELSL